MEKLANEKVREEKESRFVEGFYSFCENKGAIIGVFMLAFVLIIAVIGPSIAPYDPVKQRVGPRLMPPSLSHLFGTDQYGRDVFSRVLYGTSITIKASLVAVLLAAGIGIPVGLAAGYVGKWIDNLISRIIDIMLAFPGILLALAVVALLGPGLTNVQIAVGVSFIPSFARLVRGGVLSAKEDLYVEAARAAGCSSFRIAVRHVLPNVATSILVLFAMTIAWAIIIATSISFVGLGVQPPTPELGADLGFARDYLDVAWWVGTFPGLMIVITILAVNLVGDGLQSALSPRSRKGKVA